MLSRLSPAETNFAKDYLDIFEAHMLSQFLSHLPTTLDSLVSENTETGNMVALPQLDTCVLMRVKQDVGQVELSSSSDATMQTSRIDLQEGDVVAASYRHFAQLLSEDAIQLI